MEEEKEGRSYGNSDDERKDIWVKDGREGGSVMRDGGLERALVRLLVKAGGVLLEKYAPRSQGAFFGCICDMCF